MTHLYLRLKAVERLFEAKSKLSACSPNDPVNQKYLREVALRRCLRSAEAERDSLRFSLGSVGKSLVAPGCFGWLTIWANKQKICLKNLFIIRTLFSNYVVRSGHFRLLEGLMECPNWRLVADSRLRRFRHPRYRTPHPSWSMPLAIQLIRLKSGDDGKYLQLISEAPGEEVSGAGVKLEGRRVNVKLSN